MKRNKGGDVLDVMLAAAQVIAEIESFDQACAEEEHTDTGAVWENLLRWKNALQVGLDLPETQAYED
jgi:hypothetical protein